MVFSQIIFKPFYSLALSILSIFKERHETVFYCHTPVDMQNWLPVQKYLKPIRIVTDKAATYKYLKQTGYHPGRLPAFPKAVIMCRVAAHKFPSRKVIKIGMQHGAYHFKRFSSAQHYAPFSLYLFTSEQDRQNAINEGIHIGKVGGFPKLDPYLTEPAPQKSPDAKPTLLFTATYDSSGMSAISRWIDRLPELTTEYEVFVSVHPWMNKHYIDKLKAMPNIHFIPDNPLPYIQKANICIVDTSSIIAECCALDKPMISWTMPPAARSLQHIDEIIRDISIQVETFDELISTIPYLLKNPQMHAAARQKANSIFFDSLDGKAGLRSANEIIKILPELRL